MCQEQMKFLQRACGTDRCFMGRNDFIVGVFESVESWEQLNSGEIFRKIYSDKSRLMWSLFVLCKKKYFSEIIVIE